MDIQVGAIPDGGVRAALERVDELMSKSDYTQAMENLTDCAKANLLPLLKRLGICKFQLGDSVGAQVAFKHALEYDPSDADVLISLGDICLGTNDNRQALDYFSHAVRHHQMDVEAALGFYYAANGMNDSAARQKAIEHLRELNPEHPLLAEAARRPMPALSGACFNHGENYFGPVLLNPMTLAVRAASLVNWEELLSFHHLLVTDPYVAYVDAYYRAGVQRFGDHWRYWDISNVLFAASKLIQPRRYLEIGVRRGRSTCIVAQACPQVDIVAFDMWIPNYAGMENPGPAFVKAELGKQGHTGAIDFIDGNSHVTVPEYFRRNPAAKFDLITVDGDHSEEGALDDLCNVIPHLNPGGVIVFDDISHPLHPYLLDVWHRALKRFPHLAPFEFIETGYGVAFAIAMS
ncbi:O-methyltransferase [compost metagenome]